jgi:hypothetical protein
MATVYLELEGRCFSENSIVEVFGDYSYPAAWRVKVPCTFDPNFKCFKADILI